MIIVIGSGDGVRIHFADLSDPKLAVKCRSLLVLGGENILLSNGTTLKINT